MIELENLTRLTKQHMGFDGATVLQGSDEWLRMKLGVIGASRASDLIAPSTRAPMPDGYPIATVAKGVNTVRIDGKEFTGTKAACVDFVRDNLPPVPSGARTSYMLELVAEVATQQPKDFGQFKQTEWGKLNEGEARKIFEFHVGVPIHEIAFIYGDDSMRYGCSPDGLVDEYSGAEIKCPFTTPVHLDFLLNENIKKDYIEQCQFSMYASKRQAWHFCSYEPRMKTHSFESMLIERSESKMKTFEDAIGQMVYDVDKALSRLGIEFGSQWNNNGN